GCRSVRRSQRPPPGYPSPAAAPRRTSPARSGWPPRCRAGRACARCRARPGPAGTAPDDSSRAPRIRRAPAAAARARPAPLPARAALRAARSRRRDDAAIVEDLVAGLVADEYLHAFRLQALVEQVQEVAFLVERLEQPPQLLDARELGRAHEVGLALDDVLESALAGAALEHLLRDRDRLQHDLVHVGVRLGELAQDLLARLGERAPAELLVEIVRGALELV